MTCHTIDYVGIEHEIEDAREPMLGGLKATLGLLLISQKRAVKSQSLYYLNVDLSRDVRMILF